MDRKVIDTLIDQKNSLPSGTKYLSIYYPNDNFGVSEFKRRLKIFVKEYLQAEAPGVDAKKISADIASRLDAIDASQLDHGISIFEALGHSFMAVPLPHAPQKEILLQSTYKLDQLVELLDLFSATVVITLQKDKASFYEAINGQLKKVSEVSNDFSAQEEKEYLDKYQPTRNDQAFYGSGGRNYQASEDHVMELFLNQTEKSFAKLVKKYKPQKILVFYSSNYNNFADEFCKFLKNQYSPTEIVCKAKNMTSLNDLQKEFEKEVMDVSKKKKRELFLSSKENYPLFAGNWQEVLDAQRARKIEVLFMKKGSFQEGFLWKEEIYIESQGKKTKPVDDVVPFLVEQVLTSGGDVVVMPEEIEKKTSVAARLRY